jgi:nicotinamidase-related amidase
MATLPHARVGLGKHPALIIVDATLGFADKASPLGAESSSELAAIAALIKGFRSRKLPIAYTVNAYSRSDQASVLREKLPILNLLEEGGMLADIHPEILPSTDDLVIIKRLPSAFFGTSLLNSLQARNVDSVVVCGFSTSGCVRASAVDALQHNFRVVVASDACGDRDRYAHDANLRDIGLKYGDVISAEEAIALLA